MQRSYDEKASLRCGAAQIDRMTEEELARLWCQSVQELAALLEAADGARAPSEGAEVSSEVLARIQALVLGKLLFLCTRCARILFTSQTSCMH